MPAHTRVRFAPSPTGLLHVGNARTALYNWLFARHTGGDFILRIEDTDLERSQERHERQILEDLRWLGLDWSEGPDIGGPHAPYRQSGRLHIYRDFTEMLLRQRKAYRCFCTIEELEEERGLEAKEGRSQIYSGKCRGLTEVESARRSESGELFAVRLRIPDAPIRFEDVVRGEIEFDGGAVGDPVLVRSSGVPVYNYVVAVDDALMEITHVIRGDDHLSNTPKQVAIYQALGWPPPRFAHLSTILGADRERLSKRHGATSIASFREMGILPEALTNYLALLGWGAEGGKREAFTLEELTTAFQLERVTPSPAVFDPDKLHWLNRFYLKLASPERLQELSLPYFVACGWLKPAALDDPEIETWYRMLLDLLLPGVDRLEQLPEKAALLWRYDAGAAKRNPENEPLLSSEAGDRVVRAFAEEILACPGPVSAESFKELVSRVKRDTGVKGRELFHPIRIVLTGFHSGPEFDKLIPLIERGSELPLQAHILSVRERVMAFVSA